MEYFGYKDECDMHGHKHIEVFKEELGWARLRLLVLCYL